MSVAQRVLAFVVGVVAVFGLALGIGRWVGPIDTAEDEEHGHADRMVLTPADGGGEQAATSLVLTRTVHPAGRQQVAFTVRDGDDEPVTSYDLVHEKQLHLVLVRTDLGGYRHVHPRLDATSGEWTTALDLDGGSWRVYADFTPTGGEPTIAQADLQVAGEFTPAVPGPDNDTDSVDGYDVHLTREGDELALHVTRDGVEVTDLEPYLGAFGHLVAIRADDLAYLHVHPEEGEPGPDVAFRAELGQGGAHRLYFEFQHDGAVHRAEFAVSVGDAEQQGSTGEEGHGGEHDH